MPFCAAVDPYDYSNEVFHLAAETVIALAKLVTDVTSLVLNEENHDGVMGQARVINEHVSQGAVDMTLPKALQELLERSTDNLTDSETESCLLYTSPSPRD